ncbi:MAG: hypothetical protein ACE5JU_21580 [Candidatus Binatia bacterium]
MIQQAYYPVKTRLKRDNEQKKSYAHYNLSRHPVEKRSHNLVHAMQTSILLFFNQTLL